MIIDIAELIRSIIWGLMLCILNIIDILWEAAKLICGLDFSNSGFSWLWDWFVYIELFFLLFLVFRIIKIALKAFTDEEYMQKLNPSQWLIKMACAVVIMSAVPFCFKQATGLVNTLVDNVGYFTSDTRLYNSQKLSTLIVDSSSIDLNADINSSPQTMKDHIEKQIQDTTDMLTISKDSFRSIVKAWSAQEVTNIVPSITNTPGTNLSESQLNKVYKGFLKEINKSVESSYYDTYWYTGDVADIDINEGDEEGGFLDYFADTVTFGFAGAVDKVYYMYPTWSSLFFGLVTVIAVAFVFIPILVQMAQRVVSMVIKLFLAPYAISSIIDQENNTYSTWCKYMIADLVSNFFQVYSMMILFAFIGSSTLDSMLKSTTVVGTVAKIALILGGLLAVYTAPAGVAAIIGGSEMSAANTLSQLQGLFAMSMAGTGISVGAGALAAAGGLKLMGKSASTAGRIANRALGFGYGGRGLRAMAGNLFSRGNPDAGGTDGYGGNADASMDDLKPNDSQMQYASSLGIDGTGMTRGEMSEAVKAAGGSPSAFEALGKNDMPPTGAQLDYANSFGVDGSGMTAAEVSDAVAQAGGSSAVFEMLSGNNNGMPPTSAQMQYASSLGIDGTGMTRQQLGEKVRKAGGDTIRFNRAGGMSAADAVAANRASMMNTKNADTRNRENNHGVGNFFNSKAAALQNAGKRSFARTTYGYRARRFR